MHTPPLSSPAELLGDGASSTPKRLLDGKLSRRQQRLSHPSGGASHGSRDIGTYHVVASGRFAEDDAATPVRRPDSSMDEAAKSNRDVEIKQERMDTSSSHEEEESPLGSSGKTKKLRIEVADAESNTLNSGELVVPFFDREGHSGNSFESHCRPELLISLIAQRVD